MARMRGSDTHGSSPLAIRFDELLERRIAEEWLEIRIAEELPAQPLHPQAQRSRRRVAGHEHIAPLSAAGRGDVARGGGVRATATRRRGPQVGGWLYSLTYSHTLLDRRSAMGPNIPSRFELPLLGSNQDSPDPESGVLPVTPRGIGTTTRTAYQFGLKDIKRKGAVRCSRLLPVLNVPHRTSCHRGQPRTANRAPRVLPNLSGDRRLKNSLITNASVAAD
jgi:hypothetical protein